MLKAIAHSDWLNNSTKCRLGKAVLVWGKSNLTFHSTSKEQVQLMWLLSAANLLQRITGRAVNFQALQDGVIVNTCRWRKEKSKWGEKRRLPLLSLIESSVDVAPLHYFIIHLKRLKENHSLLKFISYKQSVKILPLNVIIFFYSPQVSYRVDIHIFLYFL
jgi:hypothetical protein